MLTVKYQTQDGVIAVCEAIETRSDKHTNTLWVVTPKNGTLRLRPEDHEYIAYVMNDHGKTVMRHAFLSDPKELDDKRTDQD